MKQLFYLMMAACLSLSFSAEAQILGKLKNKASEAAERAVIKKTEQKVTKETNKAMDTLYNEKGSKQAPGQTASNTPSPAPAGESNAGGAVATTNLWSKYNFVPGDEIIFADDLSKEENGEFPSRWDLLKGNAENASLNGEAVIKLDNDTYIAPLMNREKYLPEVFTLEFDAYFDKAYHTYQNYRILFYPGVAGGAQVAGGYLYPLQIRMNGAEIRKVEEDNNTRHYEKYGETKGTIPGWKHIAISYNKGAMKVFIDEERVLNIPKIDIDPSVFSIQAYTVGDMTRAIKNIRIAEGGKKLYDRVVSDGKIVTRGIMFDVNKASLKPESMGVINEIAALMKEHQDLKFSIEGHTDSDGDDASNLKLSEQRALAVKEALAGVGIDGSRMQVKGMGETTPVSDNNSPEGKANNRRVEFVKI